MIGILEAMVERCLSMSPPPGGPQIVYWTPPPFLTPAQIQLFGRIVEDGCWVRQRRWVVLFEEVAR